MTQHQNPSGFNVDELAGSLAGVLKGGADGASPAPAAPAMSVSQPALSVQELAISLARSIVAGPHSGGTSTILPGGSEVNGPPSMSMSELSITLARALLQDGDGKGGGISTGGGLSVTAASHLRDVLRDARVRVQQAVASQNVTGGGASAVAGAAGVQPAFSLQEISRDLTFADRAYSIAADDGGGGGGGGCSSSSSGGGSGGGGSCTCGIVMANVLAKSYLNALQERGVGQVEVPAVTPVVGP